MQDSDIELVQSSFAKVAPIADQAGALFYTKLFELDPALRPLFKGDMDAQARILMKMLTIAVGTLKDLPMLVPVAQALGRRHAGYGVQPEHYVTVGAALIGTLEVGLGKDFTPSVQTAWLKVYALLSQTMIEAAAQEAA